MFRHVPYYAELATSFTMTYWYVLMGGANGKQFPHTVRLLCGFAVSDLCSLYHGCQSRHYSFPGRVGHGIVSEAEPVAHGTHEGSKQSTKFCRLLEVAINSRFRGGDATRGLYVLFPSVLVW